MINTCRQPGRIVTGPLTLVALVLLCLASPLLADQIADHVVISEVLPHPDTGQLVFIELYNPTRDNVSLQGYYLQVEYCPATAYLEGAIPAHGFYLIGPSVREQWPSSWAEPDFYYEDLEIGSVSGGVVLKNTQGVVDAVGWGSPGPPYYEGVPCEPPSRGRSLERKSGEYHEEGRGNGQDTDNNLFDFYERAIPSPKNTNSPVESPPASTPNTSWSLIKVLFD